jgi:small subunit ribosomal protein S9
VATKPLTQTTGRRKSAVSRARLRAGSGRVTVNGRAFENYFPTTIHRNNATEALRITGTLSTYDVDVDIAGGGPAGQSGAMRLAIARSLVALDPSHRPALKRAGLLARDARRKESKKYGLKKARKAPQYTKR